MYSHHPYDALREFAQHLFGHLAAVFAIPPGQRSPALGVVAVSFQLQERANEYCVPGLALAGKPRWGDGVPVGCGQHGGLAAYEQAPLLIVSGGGFPDGEVRRTASCVVDLAPTILRHLGVAADGIDGRGLSS